MKFGVVRMKLYLLDLLHCLVTVKLDILGLHIPQVASSEVTRNL